MRTWIENELINSNQFRLSIPIQFQFKIFQFNSNSIHAELNWIDYQFQFNSWIDPSPDRGCWCPGSLRRQDISSHDIDYVEYASPGLTGRRILITCIISMWSNDIKCKYMFMFSLQNLARKELIMARNLIQSVKLWLSAISEKAEM